MPTLENKIDSSLSFRPTPVQNKRRDQKATMKVKQWNEDRLPLPKLVEIKVPDLTNLPSEHNPIRQPPSSSKDPQMPHAKKKPTNLKKPKNTNVIRGSSSTSSTQP